MSKINNCSLTILMPCLNEAETLEKCIAKAQSSIVKSGLVGEVLIADNGSTDGSVQLAEAAGARVVHVKNKGYGNALKGGIKEARGQWVIMGDADDSYDFSDLTDIIGKLQEGNDLVMGCRLPSGGGRIMSNAMPWKHRWIGNPVLSFIGKLFFDAPVTDFHCGLRGFLKSAIQGLGLKTSGMEFASEMVIKASLQGLKITQVPITLYKDGRSRAPHLRSWRDGWRHLRFMLLFSPRWLFLWPGLAMFLIGILITIPLNLNQIQIGNTYFDTNTLLFTSMLIVIGFQVTFMGIFTRIYCASRGLLPENEFLGRWFKYFSLERGLILGCLVFGIGVVFLLTAFNQWHAVGFGELNYATSLRLMIPAMTSMTIGIQMVFSSFFISVLDIEQE